jgi:antitoxin component YwqK of YwqJK toxin-antitoxin module
MIEYTVKVFDNGIKAWYLNGKLHREDGPAREYVDGTKEWYLNGELHREDGPAIDGRFDAIGGREFWYLNGKKLTEEEHAEKTNPAVEMTMAEICKALGKKVKVVE